MNPTLNEYQSLLVSSTSNKADLSILLDACEDYMLNYPANNLILHAHKEVPKFVIDPGDMPKCDALGHTHFKATASEGMKQLLEAFREL